MRALLSCNTGEDAARKLADKETRNQIVYLIKEAQEHEAKACDMLKNIVCKI